MIGNFTIVVKYSVKKCSKNLTIHIIKFIMYMIKLEMMQTTIFTYAINNPIEVALDWVGNYASGQIAGGRYRLKYTE